MEKVLDDTLFKRAMGSFVTGVTVLTTEVQGKVHAMTANAFSSLSLHPPLLLVCIHENAKMSELLAHGHPFCVNLLSQSQRELSGYFAGFSTTATFPAFSFLPFAHTQRLDGAICSVACQVEERVHSGDHVIVIGRVQEVVFPDEMTQPLVYFQGQYYDLQKLEN
ncbi:flavin reductase (DIM6/NTAB) family NADH-FMN oxidoreductase RutF [Alicyclobacillus tengchongensis]|uniref:Flavin reductase (DIM6/NTAB) family NADH-FMN oxidoreductase RutF n=2 Tax=Alicyclobacillus tolerans TaxID=90970 RepID=A0ABT9LSF4_9BACL|nr:flavin reductase (DIM6/NTAB) family NADH-FMN oxidoreductase RutF [Alicyclobacillus tengchongensis]SHL10826.1 NADH-FMN oxidoreductase RutF, flavin reductase (DIM6/NTAB) family [Alicyclobacillus montanus]